ncbi:MAG: 16S rRNA (uracil(1498)-N(3))-methyltransferase [Clostridiales bacterium]|jgi:16S rRNA (uracil1498-N3)-methyltransferase|nr:16S rRNA (uracil(1498)-N(3))-methyltransferase [Clostridiales bacterium]
MSKRFFTQHTDDDTIILQGQEYHHLVNVTRAQIGEQVIVCFNDGYDNICQIIEIKKNQAVLKRLSRQKNNNEAGIDVALFQAVPKGDKLELIVQKCAELGIKSIIPFLSQYTQTKEHIVKTERLQKIAQEAAKQCGRAVVPTVEKTQKFSDILPRLKDYDYVLMPYELENQTDIKTALAAAAKPKKIAIIIGSEGGFSQEEVKQAKEQNAQTVTLGDRILRAETAAISVAAIVMYQFDQMKKGEQ